MINIPLTLNYAAAYYESFENTWAPGARKKQKKLKKPDKIANSKKKLAKIRDIKIWTNIPSHLEIMQYPIIKR